MLTILTYAVFTGLSFFAQTWWHLLIFRFPGGAWHRRRMGGGRVAAVGNLADALAAVDGGGAANRRQHRHPARRAGGLSLLACRPCADRAVFLVGILPALLVLWIRRAVPEPEEWQAAQKMRADEQPGFVDLFRGPVRRITLADRFWSAHVAHGPLGVHVLVSAALAQPARRAGTGPMRERTGWRAPAMRPGDGRLDRRQLLAARSAR